MNFEVKKDWKYNDTLPPEDMNRIEKNIEFLYKNNLMIKNANILNFIYDGSFNPETMNIDKNLEGQTFKTTSKIPFIATIQISNCEGYYYVYDNENNPIKSGNIQGETYISFIDPTYYIIFTIKNSTYVHANYGYILLDKHYKFGTLITCPIEDTTYDWETDVRNAISQKIDWNENDVALSLGEILDTIEKVAFRQVGSLVELKGIVAILDSVENAIYIPKKYCPDHIINLSKRLYYDDIEEFQNILVTINPDGKINIRYKIENQEFGGARTVDLSGFYWVR